MPYRPRESGEVLAAGAVALIYVSIVPATTRTPASAAKRTMLSRNAAALAASG